jgi:transposase
VFKIEREKFKQVCIDDFALKKRARYGTLMIDIETHCVIDMIESRKKDDVSKWLETFPNLQIVSRDGSITYAKAITDANKQILQVSDRFHLIKNLTNYGTDYLKKRLKEKIKIDKIEVISTENDQREKVKSWLNLAEKIEKAVELKENGVLRSHICKELRMDIRTLDKFLGMSKIERDSYLKSPAQKRHEERVKQKEEIVHRVRELFETGFSQRRIATLLGIERKIVKKYLNPEFSAVHPMYGKKKKSILDDYHGMITTLLLEGKKSVEIDASLREKGFPGSSSLIRKYVSKLKRQKQAVFMGQNMATNFDFINRTQIMKLLYKPLDKVKGLTQELYVRFKSKHPKVVEVIDLIGEFKAILKSTVVNQLEGWLKRAKETDSDEMMSFANGIQRDKAAVINAIAFPYNNGLAEGKINKLKTIKRVMYGRCGFDTLRTKVLLLT